MQETHSEDARLKANARGTSTPAQRDEDDYRLVAPYPDRETTRDGKLRAARGIALALLVSAAIWIVIFLLLR